MKLYNHNPKRYFKIKLYINTGRLEVEEANATNFHPSHLTEIFHQVSEKDDFAFIVAEEKNVEKNALKLVKHHLRKVEKELTFLRKQQEGYSRALLKIQNQEKLIP